MKIRLNESNSNYRYKNKTLANERDQIIFGEPYNPKEYSGGIRRFEIGYDEVRALARLGVLNPADQQNYSPTLDKFIDFVEIHPMTTILGYVVSPERIDCRTTFDGAQYDYDDAPEVEDDFCRYFGDADEYDTDDGVLFAWYD